METRRIGVLDVHYVEHGSGRPVIVLHGAGVDHREPEACFDPILEQYGGLRRIYPDLPGMGRTPAPESIRSADDVLDVLLGFVAAMAEDRPLVIGHSAGGHYARAMAARRSTGVAGLALVCPLLPETREVPPHRPVTAADGLGDEGFRSYFVVQTPGMLDRYRTYVAPGTALADQVAMQRIGERWELSPAADEDAVYPGPALLVAGRRDSLVGFAATAALLDHYPSAGLAVLEAAGHALPHEQPVLLAALVAEWLDRCISVR